MRTPIAYLEKAGDEWLDDFVYIARQPLIERGYKIIPFDGSDMENTLLNKMLVPEEDVIIGSVEATVAYFNECGIDIPKPLGYPESLKPYLGRDIIETTFGELGNDYPYFVKPSGQVKLFTGDVISKPIHLEYLVLSGAKPETPVFKSTLVDFKCEYRCFVTNGEVRGIQYYQGDFNIYPDTHVIKDMVNSYKDCSSAYTLDVGVVFVPSKDGKHIYHVTALVEVNDMWAIGSYGFNGSDYALMCARRMKEIVRLNKK